MRLWRSLPVLFMLCAYSGVPNAQTPTESSVTGTVTDASTHALLENVHVVLQSRADSTRIATITTTRDGAFEFAHVPPGAYILECSLIGHVSFRSPEFVLGQTNLRMAMRTIALAPSVLVLDDGEVEHGQRGSSEYSLGPGGSRR